MSHVSTRPWNASVLAASLRTRRAWRCSISERDSALPRSRASHALTCSASSAVERLYMPTAWASSQLTPPLKTPSGKQPAAAL